jgi:hypothetical protein
MRILTLAPLFVLVLLGGQGSFLEDVAYAKHNATHCCMCGKCYSYCWCPGQASCPKCHSDEDETILSTVSAENLKIDIRQDTHLQLLNGVQPESIGSVMALVRASRLRGSFTLKLIDHVADHMRFKCMSLES